MLQPPCKDCEKRHVGCHSSCEDYKMYHDENVKLQEQRAEFRRKIEDYYEVRKHRSRHRRNY